MIIWAGWGILAVLFPALGAAVMASLAGMSSAGTGASMAMIGFGLAAGAVGGFFSTRWMNEGSVSQQVDKRMGPFRGELDQLVHSGQFQLGPGQPTPRSFDEAQAQANYLYDTERTQLEKQLRNRHTAFWIPAQYVAAAIGALGVVLIVLGLTRL